MTSVNDRSVFDTVTSECYSPYGNDPRRKGTSYHDRGFRRCQIIASSIRQGKTVDMESVDETVSVSAYKNGFVQGIIRAFNQDLHLVIRPDDVWQAILSQFSLFISGYENAERLRHMFVSHEGKKTLTLELTTTNLSELDFGKVAQEFVGTIQNNIADPELREWMLPDFSTTTYHDKAVAAFGIMGAMNKYFEYCAYLGCGLPSVTLLGTRDDWKKLEGRVNKLNEYGKECQHWASLLQPIMRYMTKTFDEPDSREVKDFWLSVAWESGRQLGSADRLRISGWITAFAYFGEDGIVTTDYEDEYLDNGRYLNHRRLTLDGVSYPLIIPRDIPTSLALVPITITDSKAGVKRFSTAVAGTIGMSISGEGKYQPFSKSQPFSAWWVVQEFEEPISCQPQ